MKQHLIDLAIKDNPSIGRLIGVTMKAVRGALHTELHTLGLKLTLEQYMTLKVIDLKDNTSQQDLAEILHKDKSAILRHINTLQERQLLARIPDPQDKRKNMLVLTKKGGEVYAKAKQAEENTMKIIKKGINGKDMEVFLGVLGQIRNNALTATK